MYCLRLISFIVFGAMFFPIQGFSDSCKVNGVIYSKDNPSVYIGENRYYLNDTVCGGKIIDISPKGITVKFPHKKHHYRVGAIVGIEYMAHEERMKYIEHVKENSRPIEFIKMENKRKDKLNIEELIEATIAIETKAGEIGSGFIINPDGYAITNYHVVGDNKIITAFLKGSKPIKAQVIRINPDVDLAMIDLEGKEYDFLPLGDLANTKLGMEIFVIGTPHGLSHSLSKGIISGIRKIKDSGITLLQIDASTNPGNSGGPLINMDGEAIGIVTVKIAGRKTEGLSFAISIDDAKNYLNLKEAGSSKEKDNKPSKRLSQKSHVPGQNNYFSFPDLQVKGIMYDKSKPSAIVNQELVEIGDDVQGAKVIEIAEDYVKFKYNNDFITKKIKDKDKKELTGERQ